VVVAFQIMIRLSNASNVGGRGSTLTICLIKQGNKSC